MQARRSFDAPQQSLIPVIQMTGLAGADIGLKKRRK